MAAPLRRHRAIAEAGLILLIYAVYESSRGLVGGGQRAALAHARSLFGFEQWASLDVERHLQEMSDAVPGLDQAFSLGYVTLHLTATVAALVWLYRRPGKAAYAQLRNSLVIASCASLVAFLLFPTAPPRLSGIGIADTVTRATVNLDSASIHWLYNPFAAFPSVHIAYAVLIGAAMALNGRRMATRAVGVAYPIWVSFEVIATGNHFIVDVAAGAVLGAASWWAAARMPALRRAVSGSIRRQGEQSLAVEEEAAAA